MYAALLARKPRIARRQTSIISSLPAPVGGWNARDPLSAMKAIDAITLENMIPGTGGVFLRNGYTTQATGLGSYVETLMEHSAPSGTNKLFGAVPSAIYDVSSAGAVGAAAVSSLSNGRWQHVNFATAAGNYLVLANGADSVRNFDGSSWTTPTINNVSSSSLIQVAAHAQRLWFVEKDKQDAWYLAVQSIAGDATKFPLGSHFTLGGYLMAIATWTRDGGSGPDDLIVFISSKGQTVIYSGTDPSDASNFSHVGTFKIAPPIGRRCVIKAGSDLGILTAIGLVPLSQVLAANQSGQVLVAITDKISGAFEDYYDRAGSSFGWQVVEYPRKQLLIVNVPQTERETQYQFVMNVRTGAWCKFTGINAGCWSNFGDDICFGDNSGNVWRISEDYLDDGDTIPFIVQPAFSDFGVEQNKRFLQVRPMTRAPAGYTATVQMRVDYDTTPPTAAASTAATDAALWDEAVWDEALWAAESEPRTAWQSVSGVGKVGSPALRASLSQEFVLNQMDVMFEPGGFF